jgi:hypothetical protein
MPIKLISIRITCLIFILFSIGCTNQQESRLPRINMSVNAGKQNQIIEGFGVNINPDQWNDGRLKPAIDLLVKDLGCTQFRFDCTGLANWLDPTKRNKNGKYPENYLRDVYTSMQFKDAWACFRYLNSIGIEPFFSISGRIPADLGIKEMPKQLADFDGYSEMVVTMLKWARDNEKLKFSLLAPFNETDLSYPEGPGIDAAATVPAIQAIISKLKEYGLNDIRLIVMDDNAVRYSKVEKIFADTTLLPFISKIGVHTYGMGSEHYSGWWNSMTDYSRLADILNKSPYKNCSLWMTEYGDLDQTGLAEFDFSWTITKRLMKTLKDGYSAAMFWDAFDNFHKHDTTWSRYGLLQTDTMNWKYSPRKRYYASRQIYKFIEPGFRMVEIEKKLYPHKYDVYENFHDTLTHIPILAFVSSDKKDFTIIGMSNIEKDLRLDIQLNNLAPEAYEKKIYYYRTSENEKCALVDEIRQKSHVFSAVLKERSIFTLSTLH